MKVAVTGAGGFIGRYVIAELKKHPLEIVAITTDEKRFRDKEFSVDRVIQFDIGNADEKAFEVMGFPDVLIHLAWGGLPNYRSLRHISEELPKQFNFIRFLVEGGLKSLVVSGTCFEYGMLSGPIPSTSQTNPTNPYGFAKDTLRKEIEFLRAQTNFNFAWARLFYLYGLGQSPTSLFSQICEASKRGDEVFQMSGGEQLRDYLSVQEAAQKLVELSLNPKTIVTNICSGKPISVRALVESWIKENQWSINLELGVYPYPDYEPMAFWGV